MNSPLLMLFQIAPVTMTILIVTGITSYMAFRNSEMLNKMILWPWEMKRNGEWIRFLTSGFIHGGIGHLLLNLFVLYSFGIAVEAMFAAFFGMYGSLLFLLMYLVAIVVSSVPSYFQHQDDVSYRALGASGGVSAVIFAMILIAPLSELRLLFFIPMNAALFGALFLVYSAYMAKKNIDNIGHSAHFYGALFGFTFPILFKPNLLMNFIETIFN